MVLSTILPGVLLLGIVIFFHELGHFLAAKWRGVRVLKFSLGMGPEMIGFTRGETRYCLAWIPLGGFVQMAGDSPGEDGSMPTGGPEEFLSHPWYGRVVIAVAGPFANVVTAYVALVVMCMVGISQPDFANVLGPMPEGSAARVAGLSEGDRVVGVGERDVRTWREMEQGVGAIARDRALTLRVERAGAPVTVEVPAAKREAVLGSLNPPPLPPVVGQVVTGMPAYRAGLKEGDRIVAVDGLAVERFDQIGPALHGKVDRPVRFTVQRAGRTFDLTVKPMGLQGGGDPRAAIVGIEAPRGLTWTQRFGPGEALRAGFFGTGNMIASVYGGLWLTITRPLYYREYVGGPVFIAQMSRDAARKGVDQWLYLLAMINIAVMGFNLLPVPLLDGGHIVLALVEAVRRRALSAKAYLNFQKVGLVFVGTLFILILSKDVMRPFQRLRAVDQAPRESTTVEPGAR